MNKMIFLLSVLVCRLLFSITAAEELSEKLASRTLDMAWQFDEGHFRFVTSHKEVYFELVFYDQLPNVSSYRWDLDQHEEFNQPLENDRPVDPDGFEYLVDDRRILKDQHPTNIESKDILNILKNHRVLFYTGAGISAAAGVPTMNQLNALLHLEESSAFLESILKATENPRTLATNMMAFHNACFYSPPTQAHWTIKELALNTQSQIVTENLDFLHEQTGIMPYRIDARHLKETVDPTTLKCIDYIICIGLSHDDRGFLGWYKKNHPDGKIIAIDLKCPAYLGDEDLFCQGDLEFTVQKLFTYRSAVEPIKNPL